MYECQLVILSLLSTARAPSSLVSPSVPAGILNAFIRRLHSNRAFLLWLIAYMLIKAHQTLSNVPLRRRRCHVDVRKFKSAQRKCKPFTEEMHVFHISTPQFLCSKPSETTVHMAARIQARSQASFTMEITWVSSAAIVSFLPIVPPQQTMKSVSAPEHVRKNVLQHSDDLKYQLDINSFMSEALNILMHTASHPTC